MQVPDPERRGSAVRGSGLRRQCGSVSDPAAAVGPGPTRLLRVPGVGGRARVHQPAGPRAAGQNPATSAELLRAGPQAGGSA